MKIKLYALLIVMIGMFIGRAALAENTKGTIEYDHAEIALININPDYSPFEDGLGYRLLASKSLSERFYLEADYARAVLSVGGELGSGKLSDWGSLGIGGSLPVSSNFHFISGLSYQAAQLDNSTESGYAVHLGFRSLFHPRFEFNLRFSYLDLVIEDFQVVGELYYRFANRFDWGIRVRDYADWDYTSYETGLRMRF